MNNSFLANEIDLCNETLEIIFNIFKNLLYIADKNMMELLVEDDIYLITFGALECK